jgi:lipopolysaccharide transport system ATP-binding protein
MNDTIIAVENLSKLYLVGHQSSQRGGYSTLRESVTKAARSFTRTAMDTLRGRQIVPGDTVEEFWALKDISFEITRGEVVGVIGRNGAGKSTLLKVLSRITQPTKGSVRLRGRVASLLEVGTGFHPELTGRENIYLNGAILGMTRAEIQRKFDEIVAFAEVESFLDTPVKRYSSGMYVRLAFAVAAYLEPEILVIDEVLAVGDVEFQRKCLGKMSDVARSGRTVLFVSHNQYALRALCSHGLVIQNGRASAKESIDAAINRYNSLSTHGALSFWRRPEAPPSKAAWFETIEIQLNGCQPNLSLTCSCQISTRPEARAMLIAVDFKDGASFPIMQALPDPRPFINGSSQSLWIDLEIELPPLVPGVYGLDFWIGPHNTETYDLVADAVSFEIRESPTVGRTFPHANNRGFIVPKSTARVRVTPEQIKSVQ